MSEPPKYDSQLLLEQASAGDAQALGQLLEHVTVHGSEPIEAAGGEKIDLDLNRRFESQRWHDACAH